jgi:FkbM family methyltransferase
MKSVLKKIIPKKTRRSMRASLNTIDLKYKKINKFCVNHTLTDKAKIDLKSSLEIIRKLDYDKADIFLNVDSEIEYITRLHSCKKEPEMIKWIEDSFSKGDVFYDVGANVGAYSLVAAKHFDNKIKVYAFEPSCLNFVQLSKNIFINNCQEAITPVQIALSNATGMGTFNYSNFIPGGALHAYGENIDYKGDRFEPVFRQEIFSYKMDDLIEIFKLPPPDHLKLDVDGIEFDILKGAEKTLRAKKMKSIFIELDEGDGESEAIQKYIIGYGYKFVSKHKYTAIDDDGPFAKMFNYIFVRN